MHNHSEKFTISKSEVCHNFWQPLVKKIYACNTDGVFPNKDGAYAAFVCLQKTRPNIGFEISYKQESRGYRECDKTQASCISKSFEGRGSISLIVNCEAEFLSIHFEYAKALLRTVFKNHNRDRKRAEVGRNCTGYNPRDGFAHYGILKVLLEFVRIRKHFFARSLNYRRIHRQNGFQHSKLPRTNSSFARHPETNGKLLKRNPVPDNDSVTRKNMRSKKSASSRFSRPNQTLNSIYRQVYRRDYRQIYSLRTTSSERCVIRATFSTESPSASISRAISRLESRMPSATFALTKSA